MPQVFKEHYPSTRCVIDVTETIIQSPSDPKVQQLTFCHKNHNTQKLSLYCTMWINFLYFKAVWW